MDYTSFWVLILFFSTSGKRSWAKVEDLSTHKPLVLGSNPSLAIVFINKEQLGSRFTPKGHYTNPSLAIIFINKEQLGSRFTPKRHYTNPSLAIFLFNKAGIADAL
ncbi:MAG: hypothetical protein QM231_07550 [Chloroflexota bacterium]|nr:hypothetical protein [Chloroflexota bacterium]